MRFYLLLVLSVFLFFGKNSSLSAQKAGQLSSKSIEKLHTMEDTLAVLGYAIVNDSAEVNRFAACQSLIPKLVSALKTENSFNYPFSRLNTISIIAPPDSSFRIFTWQLFVNDSTYRCYGAIQYNTGQLKLFPLVDRSHEVFDPSREELTADSWFGAIYYGIKKVETKAGSYYLLFGFNGYSFFERRKIIEVLSFDAQGKAIFGKPVFELPKDEFRGGGTYSRIVLEYAASASIKCNWDENLGVVIFDHLIPIPNPHGAGMVMVTDGDYEGFKITKNGLEYVEKIFTQTMDEAPTVYPIMENRKDKDIFGKKVKN